MSKTKVGGKLSWHKEKGSLRYAANIAFLSLIVIDNFATNQIIKNKQ